VMRLGLETGYAGYLGLSHAISARDVRSLGLIATPYKGLAKSFRPSLDQAFKILRTGVEPTGANDKHQMPNDLEGQASNPETVKVLRGYAKLVALFSSRGLKGMDAFFQVNFANMRAFNLATADAIMEGKTVPTDQIIANAYEKLYNTSLRLEDAQTQAFAEIPGAGQSKNYWAMDNVRFRMRVQELMEETRDELIAKESREGAARDAFNSPLEGILGDFAGKVATLTDVEGPHGVQILKTQVPFTTIIANVINENMSYNPLIAAQRVISGKVGFNENSFERVYGRKERVEVGIKGALGTALFLAAGTALLGPTKLSGAGPEDPEKRKALQARGWQPFSYNFGTEDAPNWWSYKPTPLFLQLATVSAYREGQEYDGADFSNDPWQKKKLGMMVFANLQAAKSMSPLQALGDMIAAIGNVGDGTADDRFMRWAQRQAGSMGANMFTLGGNLTTQVSKLTQKQLDMPKRDAKTAWQVATQNILPGNVPLAYDDLGYPMRIDVDRFQSSSPVWHDDAEASIRAFQAKVGGKFSAAFVPDAQRMNSDMAVLRQNPTAPVLTAADMEKMQNMTQEDRKHFLQKRGDLEGPMGEKLFADFRLKRAVKIREGYALLLKPLPPIGDAAPTESLEAAMERNPRQAERLLKNLYRTATRQAKLEVLGNDYGRMSYADQSASQSEANGSGGED
jgi:hypothetical protein